MRALVISSGATKMAFGIGVAEELQKQKSYDLYVGVSAGSIISLFAAANRLGVLYGALLNVKEGDIFEIPPITQSGRPCVLAILRILFGKRSLSKNGVIKKTLKKLLSPTDYVLTKPEIRVGVTNFNSGEIEYPSSKQYEYDDFINWVYASSNIPLMTEPVNVGTNWYCDGGLINYCGIKNAIDAGANEIDIILHSPLTNPSLSMPKWVPSNMFKIAERTLQIMHEITFTHDMLMARALAQSKGIKINFYSPAQPLVGTIYTLDSETMKAWYECGIQASKQPSEIL